MVKVFKGFPDLREERYKEAWDIKHCALSLVGEPIMYPSINKLLTLLHIRGISTFLVTNAQWPDKIRDLIPITQLYVSVDAPTKEKLKKIDRPLFKDFWERFVASLLELKKKKQRTVYRITLVRARNCDETEKYAELIKMGEPDFIEVKGVTFAGFSDSSGLTLDNCPFHYDVVEFCRDLTSHVSSKYEIACEHEHSVCVLIAQKKFKKHDGWYTHIDYEKFNQLVRENRTDFSSEDYMKKTPDWAIVGAREKGFNPEDKRHLRKKRVSHGC
eukprot:TRINITY_DN64489_c0_g1_i1.p1 TRINITY_DN64489_c0_g1~~TRINITY_DN64489_c0_g1_i1.p1  ORF type:complete len:315 (-),score=8.47 TRINITY_DN64489_c0_g1_i1:108-923(-)